MIYCTFSSFVAFIIIACHCDSVQPNTYHQNQTGVPENHLFGNLKREIIFQTSLFRFHVSFQGCIKLTVSIPLYLTTMSLTGNIDSPSSVATEGSKKAGNEAAARKAANHGNNGLDRRMGGNFKGNMEMEFYPATGDFLAPRLIWHALTTFLGDDSSQQLKFIESYSSGLTCSCWSSSYLANEEVHAHSFHIGIHVRMEIYVAVT